jgi:hypothetical protein
MKVVPTYSVVSIVDEEIVLVTKRTEAEALTWIEERRTKPFSDTAGRPKHSRDPDDDAESVRKFYTGRAIRPTGRRLLDPRPSHE